MSGSMSSGIRSDSSLLRGIPHTDIYIDTSYLHIHARYVFCPIQEIGVAGSISSAAARPQETWMQSKGVATVRAEDARPDISVATAANQLAKPHPHRTFQGRSMSR